MKSAKTATDTPTLVQCEEMAVGLRSDLRGIKRRVTMIAERFHSPRPEPDPVEVEPGELGPDGFTRKIYKSFQEMSHTMRGLRGDLDVIESVVIPGEDEAPDGL